MRREQYPSFHEHDTSLMLWLEDPKDPAITGARDTVVKHLRSRGFHVCLDKRIKQQYPILRRYHHEGRKGLLQFKLRLSGRCLELTFFQNVVRENRYGGEHDFDKRRKMPYLIGKQYEAERNAIALMMVGLGYSLQLEQHRTGNALIEFRRAELTDFQGPQFYARKWESYNIKSAAGREISDGDCVYFRHWDGRLRRGIGYRNINNMWWVLLPCGDVENIGAHGLWHREDLPCGLRGRMFKPNDIEKRLRRKLKQAIASESFERAAVIRDVLRATFPAVAKAA